MDFSFVLLQFRDLLPARKKTQTSEKKSQNWRNYSIVSIEFSSDSSAHSIEGKSEKTKIAWPEEMTTENTSPPSEPRYLADCEKATVENRHEAAKLEEVPHFPPAP